MCFIFPVVNLGDKASKWKVPEMECYQGISAFQNYSHLFSLFSKSELLFHCRILQIKFSKKMCLEHDEKLISYLSMLRDIEMRIKRVQPAGQNVDVLQTLLQQAEVSTAPAFVCKSHLSLL